MIGLSPEQRAYRIGKIGASNTAGIMRRSPWSSPIEEWIDITEGSDSEESDATESGHRFEPALLMWAADRLALPVALSSHQTFTHADLPWMIASPDGLVYEALAEASEASAIAAGGVAPGMMLGTMDAKVVGPRVADHWHDEGGVVRAPQYVIIQVQHQMMVLGVRRGWIAAVIFGWAGTKFHVEPVTYSDSLAGEITAALTDFHAKYIATNTPPPTDGSKACAEVLTRRHPKPNGALLEPTDADWSLRIKREELLLQRDVVARQLDEIDNRARERIGDNLGLKGMVKWSERKGSISYAKVCDALAAPKDLLEKFRGPSGRTLRWED